MPAPTSLELRVRIKELLECGMTHESIADDLSVPRTTVTGIKLHIETHGHIYPVRPPGNTPTISEDDYPAVKKIVLENPDLSLAEYAKIISDVTGKNLLSEPSICRILKKLNLRRKKKSKYPEERDRDDVKKKRADFCDSRDELLENNEIRLEDLVFLDESGLKLGQSLDYARAEGGKRVCVSEPKNLGKNITVIAAISIVGVISAMYCTCNFDGSGFLSFIEAFLLPHLIPGQILIMDNVNFHKMKNIIGVIQNAGIRVVFLPQYSPELNPIENMWSKLKSYLKKMKVKTIEQLQIHLKKGLELISEYDCESWFDHCGYV